MCSTGPSSSTSEELEDYMSDDFLVKCQDIRPGVVSGSEARKRKIECKQHVDRIKIRRLKMSTIEDDVRSEALNKPLSSDNKGFLMLAKMGFKVGSKLGKRQENGDLAGPSEGGSGLKDPLAIDLKLDKKGLGHKSLETERKAVADSVRQFKNKANLILTRDFGSRQKEKVQYKSILTDFQTAQKTCYDLDARENVEYPTEPWYWPSYALPEEEEAFLSEEQTGDSKRCVNYADLTARLRRRVLAINSYTRSTYCYCMWCAIRYDNADDLVKNCPGCNKDDHETDFDQL